MLHNGGAERVITLSGCRPSGSDGSMSPLGHCSRSLLGETPRGELPRPAVLGVPTPTAGTGAEAGRSGKAARRAAGSRGGLRGSVERGVTVGVGAGVA